MANTVGWRGLKGRARLLEGQWWRMRQQFLAACEGRGEGALCRCRATQLIRIHHRPANSRAARSRHRSDQNFCPNLMPKNCGFTEYTRNATGPQIRIWQKVL